MTSEPSEEAISNFTSFTNTTREQAISFLKANDLDSNKAINAYFEDPTGPHVSAYRDDTGASAYQIEHSDAAAPAPIPPSRPPSTSTMRDAALAADLPPPPAPAQDTKGNGLSLAEQEERQLQQAVAMSLNQNLGQQETGVTTTNQNFGRATRDHYEQDDWAMTLFNSSAREIVISPDPVDRKKQPAEPAFIRPTRESLHLSGLITILHSIPLAREALLLRNKVLSDYGKNAQWWDGQPIYLPKIVTIHEAQDGDTDWDDILHESQRLIAFLDSTNRAFGSIDTLAGLKQLETYDSDKVIGTFLESWQGSAVTADPGNPLATVFSSMAYRRPPKRDDSSATGQDTWIDEEPTEKEFFTLEPYPAPAHGQTLYDVLDEMIWADTPGAAELDDVWLEHVADILTVQLSSVDAAKAVDVKIPATFYPDRYLANCREIAREYRLQRLQIREDVVRLQGLMDRISAPGSAKGVTSREVLEKAADAAVSLAPSAEPNEESTSIQQLAVQLKAISRKIEDKLKGVWLTCLGRPELTWTTTNCLELESRQQQAQESLKSYSKYLTEPSTSPGEPPVHKYTLRGVCTEPHVTYVLRRSIPEDNTEPKPDEYEWWRISFSVDDAKSRQAQTGHPAPKEADVIGYTARKVREIEVLRAAREESKSVLLVYANSNAMNYKEEPAPAPLQRFVHEDNAAFETELQEWENTAATRLNAENDWEQTVGSRPAYPSPSIGQEDVPASKVNVFDYQVSSFDDDPATPEGQEMEERGGKPLLSQATSHTHPGQDTVPEWSN
ncbi:uncharacterized protein DSM5745_07032 [Aspergillus mulundensis]|uniref:Ubiquitin interaction motif protein n=1 Tax=Aspergillus mulundensis TaxID=1810919 RepID=A0A3D8RK68_9EURO|nr:Uncharacterized protein DSM5745_07032 [Aspergillus mulundensis]RDW74370.1 Uncharacterized protein DSM5745_07032 [Aspergillus mulundensis]